jgi:hypothetical protein
MTIQHPIVPPSKLLDQWDNLPISTQEIFVIAAQWGADMELKACRQWMQDQELRNLADQLYYARRPKSPSLKELALEQLESIEGLLDSKGLRYNTILAALESLPDD